MGYIGFLVIPSVYLRKRNQGTIMADEKTEPPLTDEELKALRSIIKQDDRRKWLWASIRTKSVWFTAVAGGVTLFWDLVKQYLRDL